MNDSTKNKVATQIITDAILTERVFKGFNQVINAVSPDKGDFCDTINHYTGFTNAYEVLGFTDSIEDEYLTDQFHSIFFEQFNKQPQLDARKLAESIFIEWNRTIKLNELLS
jgi:hypothetical protein